MSTYMLKCATVISVSSHSKKFLFIICFNFTTFKPFLLVLPVCRIDNATTVQLLLDIVPCLSNSSISRLVVVLQSIIHVGLYALVEVILEDEGCNGGSELREEDE